MINAATPIINISETGIGTIPIYCDNGQAKTQAIPILPITEYKVLLLEKKPISNIDSVKDLAVNAL